jgi:hypothetical protein
MKIILVFSPHKNQPRKAQLAQVEPMGGLPKEFSHWNHEK